jgi:hypothetical protein
MYGDYDPRPDAPPPTRLEFVGVVAVLVVLFLIWLIFYALRHGWFKTIPI